MSAGSRFDRTADRYVEHAARRDWSGFLEWCEPRGHDRALDVAGGPGLLAGALLGRVAQATVLDASARLLEHAPAGVVRVLGRAEQLPFADASFELVTCVNSLHHIARPPRALDEMARVLAPGGRIVLEDFVSDPDPARARRWEEVERIRDPEHGRLMAPGEPRGPLLGAGLELDAEETWLRVFDVDEWLDVAGCAGSAAATVRDLIAAPTFELRVWRARFRRPAD
ncbi:MAG TPA: class I SAM-dependent methyltransferase [Gaiellales bacterium]|nr:class I SAM-dependent methyltransferase [Gaiellales bacterium]